MLFGYEQARSALAVIMQHASTTVESTRVLTTLQLGKSWFPEQAGSGLDRVYYALIQHLGGAGVNVHGIVAGSPGVRASSRDTVRPFASEKGPLLRRMWKMRQAVSEVLDAREIDLVASHFALYTFPVLDLLRNVPLVVHFHGPWAHESGVEGDDSLKVKTKRALEQAVYRRGVRFIVLSEAFGEVLNVEYGISPERIHIVPGGVEVEQFSTGLTQREARERLGWPLDRPIVLTVRRLVHRMGLEPLIEAFARVHTRIPDAMLYIAGHGPLADELKARAEAAGLKHYVKLLGFVPDEDLPLAYRGATLSVVPSVALEGFGLITLESLAAGTPVLVTPVGGLPEAVRDLSPDLILPDCKVDTLAERVVDVLQGDGSLPSSAECRDYARRRFAWSVIAAQTREVYERAVG